MSLLISAAIGSTASATIGIAALCLALGVALFAAVQQRKDLSAFLIVPVFISAFQNVYLSPFAAGMSETAASLLISANLLLSITFLIVLTAGLTGSFSAGSKTPWLLLTIVLLQGSIVYFAQGNGLSAAIASARNLTSPFVFLLIGMYAGRLSSSRKFLQYVIRLGWAVLAFAAFEYLFPDFWRVLGLHNLWALKGIPVQPDTLLPLNFYASEQLEPGAFLRRMAGPFADPVNFGTFLFALIAISWFMKSRALLIASLVQTGLAVSKGALLGIMTLITIRAKRYSSKPVFVLVAVFAAATALYFYAFTVDSSTGSTQVHINGFIASIAALPEHPLGRGFGSTGVLSNLLSPGANESSLLVESGIGMVIGQLGVAGIGAYAALFVFILRRIKQLPENRNATLAYSLLVGFALIAIFNEVALSPNSSALVFLVIGLLLSKRAEMATIPVAPRPQLRSSSETLIEL